MAMWRSTLSANLVRQASKLGFCRFQNPTCSFSTSIQNHISTQGDANAFEDKFNYQIGQNVSGKDKISTLISTLKDVDDSKESVYGALNAWVAWEQEFPIGRLKTALITLEKEHQWHRAIQVIKWMLSKGQGVTVGTYGRLIRALDMDRRAEEAHEVWVKKLGGDLHSVPWKVCDIIISVYYGNNMLENLVRLFRGLEAFDRKPREKSLVQKVADAYEMLGLVEEKECVLEKYKSLFIEAPKGRLNKSGRTLRKKLSKAAETKHNSKPLMSCPNTLHIPNLFPTSLNFRSFSSNFCG